MTAPYWVAVAFTFVVVSIVAYYVWLVISPMLTRGVLLLG